MPITLSYDLKTDDTKHRTYIRSMLERFYWRRLGGSVFRYAGVTLEDGTVYEDWLNHVVPAVMFMRSYLLSRGVSLRFLTIDAFSTSYVDNSDAALPFGRTPQPGAKLDLTEPSNVQSSEDLIRRFVDAAVGAVIT